MRQATAQALHHAAWRAAFGKKLIDQPLMRNVLADLALESEAATVLVMRVAGAFDRSAGDPREAALARLLTPIAKYWICKRAPIAVVEALECLGGNGYVEESILPRLYREAPVNSVWEGSGNVICLDVLRAIGREPDALAVLLAEIGLARGGDARLDRALAALERALADRSETGAPRPPAGRAARAGRMRERSSCAMRRPRSPMPTAPAVSARRSGASSARCRPASTSRRSASAPARCCRKAQRFSASRQRCGSSLSRSSRSSARPTV